MDGQVAKEATLIARFGFGYVDGIRLNDGSYLEKTYCYYVPQQNIWVKFTADYHHPAEGGIEIDEIFLSKESLCAKRYVPKTPFKKFVTTRGIRIGSLEKDVIRAYGKATRVDDSAEREKRDPSYKDTDLASKYGSKGLIYLTGEDSLLAASFYIKDGRVYSINISSSE